MAKPNRRAHADLGFDAGLQAHHKQSGRCAVEPLRAGELEKRFVEREGLNEWGKVLHERANVPRGIHIDAHARLDDRGLGAQLERLKHRHRRAHTVNPRDIAAGRNNTTPPAAYDNGFLQKAWIVALFHGGIERITIHVRYRKLTDFRALHNPWAAARRAARGGREAGETVSAICGVHKKRIGAGPVRDNGRCGFANWCGPLFCMNFPGRKVVDKSKIKREWVEANFALWRSLHQPFAAHPKHRTPYRRPWLKICFPS